MNTLTFAGKEFGTIRMSDNSLQGVFRFTSRKDWMPHDGIVPCPGKTIPVIPETERFWRGEKYPGYETEELKRRCEELEGSKTCQKKGSAYEVNECLGAHGEELNDNLAQWDKTLCMTDRKTIGESAKALEARTVAPHLGFLETMLAAGKHRLQSARGPLLGSATLACAALLLFGSPAKAGTLVAEVQAAHGKIQTLSGAEIKGLLASIPEADRVALVKYLPKGVIPGFLPRELAAKNLGLAPAGEIKKGFDRMSESEFQETAKKIGEKAIRNLLGVLEGKKMEMAMQ